jgi:uncharacterized membrane protein
VTSPAIAPPAASSLAASSVALERLALAGILLLAAWLRLHDLTAQSLWWDEVMSLRQARLGLADLLAATAEDNYPPLHNLILHAVMQIMGPTELAVRLPSALLGIATVGLVYWVGTMSGGRRAGLIAAALLAVSGFHVWYSHEGRMYALLAFAATLFAGALLRWIETRRIAWAVASILAATALLYSHVYGAFTWAAIGLGAMIILPPWRWPGLVLQQAVALLFFVPWMAVLAGRADEIGASGFWIPPLTPWTLVQMLVQLSSGPFMLAALAVGIRLACRPPRTTALRLLLAWAAVPLVLGIAISLAITPMLLSRYLIGSLPALAVLAGIGLARAQPLTLAAAGVAALTGLFAYAPPVRDDFRGVAAALATELKPDDCLVMIPEAAFALFYYLPTQPACLQAARHFADIRFPTAPKRILVLATMDADVPAIASLGTITGERSIGPTRLIAVLPR